MQRKLILFALAAILTLSANAQTVNYLTTEQFKAKVFNYTADKEWKYKGDKPCIIDFYTTWCGPCKRLAPIMEELSRTYCDQVLFYKADTERERELAYVFGINSIPQVLYIPVKGKPMMLKGLYPKEEIVQIIEDFLLPSVQEEEPAQEPQEEVKPATETKKPSLWERLKYKVTRKKEAK